MKILITGSNGQLGNEFRALTDALPGSQFLFTDYLELDITSTIAVEAFMADFKPDWIINCAAYTSVDKAELEPEKTRLLNVEGPALLARTATAQGARMIHLSTDYVFDGTAYKPYTEADKVNPNGVYAHSKADGEERVLQPGTGAIVVRTSWLYSVYGHNFVKTILRVAREKGELTVVSDQLGSPTWAADLAQAILNLIRINAAEGIYHFSNEGVCSWYDFAHAITELAGIHCVIKPTDTSGYPLPAPRPHYSLMSKGKYVATTGQTVPYWRESLKKCIALLNEQG